MENEYKQFYQVACDLLSYFYISYDLWKSAAATCGELVDSVLSKTQDIAPRNYL